jgi:hypothetical protein
MDQMRSLGEDSGCHVEVRNIEFLIGTVKHRGRRQTLHYLRNFLEWPSDKWPSESRRFRFRPQHHGRKRDLLLQQDVGWDVQTYERLLDVVDSRSGRQLEAAMLSGDGPVNGCG